MRKVLFGTIIMIIVFSFSCSEKYSEKFAYTPVKPQIGDQITVKYNPEGTVLERAKEVSMLAYQFFGAKMPTVQEVMMKKKGKGFVGTFTPNDSSLVIFINFIEDETIDNNEKAGYKIELFDTCGNYLPGELATQGYVYYSGGYPVNIKRDRKLALSYIEQEFAQFPEQREEYQSLYFDLLVRVDKENGKARVKAVLDSIAAKDELTLKEKELLASWYSRVGEKEKSDSCYDEVLKLDPHGKFAEIEKFRQFRSLPSLSEKAKFYKIFSKEFPKSNYSQYMTSMILRAYTAEKRYDEAEEFLVNDVSDATASEYNSIAWDMVNNGVNLKTAAELAKKGLELARKTVMAPVSEKPSYLTEKQWRKNLKIPLGNILDTYAFALYKLGKAEESMPLFKEAVEILNKENKDVNERYARVLIETRNNDKALEFTEELLKMGIITPNIEKYFKDSWIAVKGSDEGLEQFFEKIKAEGLERLKAELAKKMIEKPAPKFSLEDLDGNIVSLDDLAGKTIIVDFWATWCGPCKVSFPAMQKAIEKFKEDENVRFLFINTWERGDDVKEKVAKFIKDHNYPFQVLFDTDSKVVEAFYVEGIPTKFVIDKNGKIRFKNVGYGGDEEKLVDELSLMIDMVK